MPTDPLLMEEINRWCASALDWLGSVSEIEAKRGAGLRLSVLRGRKHPGGDVRNDMSLSLLIQDENGRKLAEPIELSEAARRAVGDALANRRSLVAAAISETPEAIQLLKGVASFLAAWERAEMRR